MSSVGEVVHTKCDQRFGYESERGWSRGLRKDLADGIVAAVGSPHVRVIGGDGAGRVADRDGIDDVASRSIYLADGVVVLVGNPDVRAVGRDRRDLRHRDHRSEASPYRTTGPPCSLS
jgi:hypothetical protein